MDVCILAGGKQTRLAGILDNLPKCLVKIEGETLLAIILEKLRPLEIGTIFLLLGDDERSEMVVQYVERQYKKWVLERKLVISRWPPTGTAEAIRSVRGLLSAPVMVLNGDTAPLYDFQSFINSWGESTADSVLAWHGGKYAGAAILNRVAIRDIVLGEFASLDEWTNNFRIGNRYERCIVDGFIDVGTPEGLMRALTLREMI